MRTKASYFWFVLFALCFISYQLVQDEIRPNYSGENDLVRYFLGIAPNFFPSIGMPALFVLLIPSINTAKNPLKWLNEARHMTANAMSQLGLLSWEFMQITTTSGRFDRHDIIWTVLGGIVFHFIWKITPTQYKVQQQ